MTYLNVDIPYARFLSSERPSNQSRKVTLEELDELNRLLRQNDTSFMVKFHEYFPSFIKKMNELTNFSLNYSEVEICACTKLGFSTKEIALYRKCTIRSVENRKYRIRKKLRLGSTVDFIMWIAGIE